MVTDRKCDSVDIVKICEFLSPYTAARPRGHSRQVGAVVAGILGRWALSC